MITLSALTIVSIGYILSAEDDQEYVVTSVDDLSIYVNDPLVDTGGADAVIQIQDVPPKVLFNHLITYLFCIGGPAGLCYAFPILGRLEKKALLRNGNRNRIYEYIKANPGCTREDINKQLSINIGTVYHHVATLKLWGLASYEKNGKFKMIYSGEMIGSSKQVDRTIYAHIRNDMARTILQTILKQPGINQKALVQISGRDDSTIHWHLKRFSQDGLITIKNDGIYKRCTVNPDYKPTLEKYLGKA
jgi:predicted transcriptional regulator